MSNSNIKGFIAVALGAVILAMIIYILKDAGMG